jgi:uncharacterized membrane protein
MTIYNKSLVYIGFLIAVAGAIIGHYGKTQILTVVLQIIGIIMMFFSFKKPKGEKKQTHD